MESPTAIGDTTTNSISQRLSNTHLSTNFVSTISAAVYSGEKCIQLSLKVSNDSSDVIVLRRVQDSYVNVSQLLGVLVKLNLFSTEDIERYINRQILSNSQFFSVEGYTPEYNDLSSHRNELLKGVWIPFDRAVSVSNVFDIYQLVKKLFLVDVHDFDELPKANTTNLVSKNGELSPAAQIKKRKSSDNENDTGDDNEDENSSNGNNENKKMKYDEDDNDNDKAKNKDLLSLKNYKILVKSNPNYPYTLQTISTKDKDHDMIHDIKQKFGEIFKKNETSEISTEEMKSIFEKYLPNKESIMDIPLDSEGKTALHFASTLASINLVSSLITLGLNSPIRGSKNGETPLVSAILVTNSMEKDNFSELLSQWLYPCLFLISSKNWSFLHFLSKNFTKKHDSCKYYFTKILHYIFSSQNNQYFFKLFLDEIINLQTTDGDTALHFAIENENKWLIEILIEMKADLNVTNKLGLKPADFDLVKEVLNYKKLGIKNDYFDDDDHYLIELIRTNIEFLSETLSINNEVIEDEEIIKPKEEPVEAYEDDSTATTKLFNSINELLKNTNQEYQSTLNNKRKQINEINKQLYDTTLITANNKFLNKKIHDKLMHLDNLKLQMTNITEKLEMIKNELPNDNIEEKFDADQPFRIDTIYQKLLEKGEDATVKELKNDKDLINQLPEAKILKARINSYKQLNNSIEGELQVLNDYSNLTSKFKKVVSFCTGVDINEVDELLDGLLEAVESQS